MRLFVRHSAASRVTLLSLVLAACVPASVWAAPTGKPPAHPQVNKPAPPAAGLPPPQAYKPGTAERALAEFLAAWHDKDFTRMAQFTDITWKHLNPVPSKVLRKEFTLLPAAGARIVGPAARGGTLPDPGENVKNLNVTIRYGAAPHLYMRTVTVTVYRDSAPYEESAKGTWGVSPDFALSLPEGD